MKDSSFYNQDYFKPVSEGGTGTFGKPFTWEVEQQNVMKAARILIDKFNPVKVLDAGCAKGFTIKALLSLNRDAYGCDISQWAINNCEPEVKGRIKQCDLRFGLPYKNNEFDVIYSNHTLEHIEMEFLNHVISEFRRVTNSWIYIGIPTVVGFENAPWGDKSHVTYMHISYWISLFYMHDLLFDLSRSAVVGLPPYFNVELAFYKRKDKN